LFGIVLEKNPHTIFGVGTPTALKGINKEKLVLISLFIEDLQIFLNFLFLSTGFQKLQVV